MKYTKNKLTETQAGIVVKSLLLLGEKKIIVEKTDDDTYKISTEKAR